MGKCSQRAALHWAAHAGCISLGLEGVLCAMPPILHERMVQQAFFTLFHRMVNSLLYHNYACFCMSRQQWRLLPCWFKHMASVLLRPSQC